MLEDSFTKFDIQDLPEFNRYQAANPNNPNVNALSSMIMFGRAIHWVAVFDIIWPKFEEINFLTIEVGYLVINDPDDANLPPLFYNFIAHMIAMFWEEKLKKEHPNWIWEISIDEEPQFTLSLAITSKS